MKNTERDPPHFESRNTALQAVVERCLEKQTLDIPWSRFPAARFLSRGPAFLRSRSNQAIGAQTAGARIQPARDCDLEV